MQYSLPANLDIVSLDVEMNHETFDEDKGFEQTLIFGNCLSVIPSFAPSAASSLEPIDLESSKLQTLSFA